MPRVRGFRDPKTIDFNISKPRQIERLSLSNRLRITTSRLSKSQLDHVVQKSHSAHTRHLNLRSLKRKFINSPNDGQTVAIKDNFVTKELPTTCASNILDGFSAQDATVVKLLKDAGMSVVAKTNMDEFGMGSHSTHSIYGAVRNGIGIGNQTLSAGGSSGGSAMAVAVDLVDSALGSDTGGSVRLPAAYTGVVGFKPTYGMISRHGLIPYANSLDTVGIFARNCLDVLLLNDILSRYDDKDPTSLTMQSRKRLHNAKKKRVGRRGIFTPVTHAIPFGREHIERDEEEWNPMAIAGRVPNRRRVGVPVEYNIQEMHHRVRNAWMRTLTNLEHLGHEIVPISLPSTQQALSAYYVIAPAEASSNLAKYDGVRYGKLRSASSTDDEGGVLYSKYRGTHFGDEVKRRILLGSFSLSAGAMDNYFIQAQKVRRLVQQDFDLVFRMANPLLPKSKAAPQGVDYILCPTAPTPPPTLSEVENMDPLNSYINDVFTVPASLAGLPAISVPASRHAKGFEGSESSIGMQLIGQFGDDKGVINFARRWLEDGDERRVIKKTTADRPKL